jgi:RND family efflux transporter MFP subunit
LQDLDQSQAAEDAAAGALQQAQATLQTNKLNLSFTKVTAPIKGRTSNFSVTIGNLIVQDQTLLTTIVSIDPMYAYFDVDERTVLHVRRLIREGKAKSARDTTIPVYLALANDVGFPHQGKIDFVDNQNNLKTGTLRIRGVFENSKEILTPGLFVRVRIPIGQPHQALLITDRAIDTDLGEKIVYIVNEQDKIETRRVTLGKQHNGLRAIEEGLQSSDRVVINGLQQIRPGLKVVPKLVKQQEQEKSITPATDSGSHSKPEPSNKPDEKTDPSSQQTPPESATGAGAKPSSGEPAPSKPPENGAATPAEEPSQNTTSGGTPSQNTTEKKSADGASPEASASVVAFRILRQRASAALQNEPAAFAWGSPRGATVLVAAA